MDVRATCRSSLLVRVCDRRKGTYFFGTVRERFALSLPMSPSRFTKVYRDALVGSPKTSVHVVRDNETDCSPGIGGGTPGRSSGRIPWPSIYTRPRSGGGLGGQ